MYLTCPAIELLVDAEHRGASLSKLNVSMHIVDVVVRISWMYNVVVRMRLGLAHAR